MVTYMVLVRPALMKLAGKPHSAKTVKAAIAGEAMTSDGRRTFARVRLQEEEGKLIARETGTQSSGAHMSMVLADGLLILMIIPEGHRQVEPGEAFDVMLLKDIR